MASEKGPVATEAPPLSSSTISQPSLSVEALQADATRATASLKRARETTPTASSSVLASHLNSDLSPSKVARLATLASRRSPAPLTGAAALEDERRRQEEQYRQQVSGESENPAFKVQSQLLSSAALGLSRPQDAPPMAPEVPLPPPPTSAPEPSEPKADTSPQSTDSMTALSAETAAPDATSPVPMEIDPQLERAGYAPQPQAQMEEKTATSLSYPGLASAAAAQMPAPPVRGMSLPMTPGQLAAPKSPGSKKHKCPYCETEFTRHHNLKSHMLTHSQEKPYPCQTCNMKFRRLHDLKRHSKLHTGEKPHVCPRCDRKFARGDALARHSKGPGGCVSRRGSLFGEDDFTDTSQLEGDHSAMAGVVYDGGSDAGMSEEDRRRLSMPAIKAQHVQGNQSVPEGYTTHSRTYPPVSSSTGRLFPPSIDRGSGSSTASQAPVIPAPGGAASMFSQTGMTESPKPLEPVDANINRQRSPSLTTQFQQQHFGRHQTEHQNPPGSSHFSSYPEALIAQLGSAPGFGSNDGRFTASGQSAGQGATNAQTGSTNAATATGQSGGSGDSANNNLFATDQGVWAYIHSLEEVVKELAGRLNVLEQTEKTQDERIIQLTAEVSTLRGHLDTRSPAPEQEPTG